MFINAYGFYVPSERVQNEYFKDINGLTAEWILQRTGIETRSRVSAGETGVDMGKAAVANALKMCPFPVQDIDLIISAGYAPEDTVGTLAHIVQREYLIENAKVMMVSAACSSCVNALEIIEAFFESGKARKALLISSEINSLYANESDPSNGHLWGDAAIAMVVSKERVTGSEPEICEITTSGLGHIGKGPEGVNLSLVNNAGIQMKHGKDVFLHATHYMTESLKTVAERRQKTLSDLDYILAHQANMRIISNMLHLLEIPESKSLNNIQTYGNTGSASAFLVLMENWNTFKPGMHVGLTVFGGGYSAGAVLIRF